MGSFRPPPGSTSERLERIAAHSIPRHDRLAATHGLLAGDAALASSNPLVEPRTFASTGRATENLSDLRTGCEHGSPDAIRSQLRRKGVSFEEVPS